MVFKAVLSRDCLDYIKGTGLEDFVQLPWLKVVNGVFINKCLEFIGNKVSETQATKFYNKSFCLTKKVVEDVNLFESYRKSIHIQ